MRNYEMMIIFDADTPFDENQKFVQDTFKTNQVNISEEKDIGVRRLAYQINRKDKGHYYLVHFEAEQKNLNPINNEFRLFKGIMRQLTVKKDS